MSETKAITTVIAWLRQRHDAVMDVERQALARLEAGDTPGHNSLMQQKAQLLADLSQDAKTVLAALPGETRFNVALALERFSASARTALQLHSVFYMSALLYPDDHKPGQPDNLTLCIDRLERQGLDFTPA